MSLAITILLLVSSLSLPITCTQIWIKGLISPNGPTSAVCTDGDPLPDPLCAHGNPGFYLDTDKKGCVDRDLTVYLLDDLKPSSGKTSCNVKGCIEDDVDHLTFYFRSTSDYLYPCGSNHGVTITCSNPFAACLDAVPKAVYSG